MQPLFVERPGTSDVQVDRCPACAGLWFELGELDAVLGEELPYEVLDGDTTRRCPDCTLSLTPGLLGPSIPVETCSACRGLWFDWEDVQELNHQALSRVARPAAGAARYEGVAPTEEPPPRGPGLAAGFDCAKCGARTPFSDAHGTARGLVCSRCVPRTHASPELGEDAADGRGAAAGVLWGLSSLVDLLDLLP